MIDRSLLQKKRQYTDIEIDGNIWMDDGLNRTRIDKLYTVNQKSI
jgi:hypothetical protein